MQDTTYYDEKLKITFHDSFEIDGKFYPLEFEHVVNYSDVIRKQVKYLNSLIYNFKKPKNIKDLLKMCKIKIHSKNYNDYNYILNSLFNELELIIGQNLINNTYSMQEIMNMQSELELLKTYFLHKGLVNFTTTQEDFSKKLERIVIDKDGYVFKKWCY